MFEAKLNQGSLLKKVLESVKELVTEANFDCAPTGFTMQAMDSSHVSLVALNLRSDGFEAYRCDRPVIMGESARSLGLSFPLLDAPSDTELLTRVEPEQHGEDAQVRRERRRRHHQSRRQARLGYF